MSWTAPWCASVDSPREPGRCHAGGERALHGKVAVLGLHGSRRVAPPALLARPLPWLSLRRDQQGRRCADRSFVRRRALPGLRRFPRFTLTPPSIPFMFRAKRKRDTILLSVSTFGFR